MALCHSSAARRFVVAKEHLPHAGCRMLEGEAKNGVNHVTQGLTARIFGTRGEGIRRSVEKRCETMRFEAEASAGERKRDQAVVCLDDARGARCQKQMFQTRRPRVFRRGVAKWSWVAACANRSLRETSSFWKTLVEDGGESRLLGGIALAGDWLDWSQ